MRIHSPRVEMTLAGNETALAAMRRNMPDSTASLRSAPITLDIGGEGRHPGAWNLNLRRRKTIGPQRGELIPQLIQGRGERIPLRDHTVDVLIVERMPLRPAVLTEILRVARASAQVILRHANAHSRDPHHHAVQILQGAVEQRLTRIGRQTVQETVIRLSHSAAMSQRSSPEGT